MSRPNAARLAGVLLAVALAMVALALAKPGGFFIAKHEGDTVHLAEMVLRMAEGQWPHLDFMTPIGVLALAPISALIALGLGIGHAILLSQLLVALLLLPAVLWTARTRMSGIWPYLYGAYVMILCTALVHGEAERSVSISMHYNRWAWAVSYVLLPLALLPPLGRERQGIDGLVIGLGMAFLALAKVTYFVAFFPPVAFALLARRQFRAVGVALLAGVLAAGLVTVLAGTGFWAAYLHDLVMVSGSEVRPQPGEPIAGVIAAPAYMGASLMLLAAIIFLRQGGMKQAGLFLLLLLPGFFFVTYQNYGNDPQWLYLVGLLMLLLRPATGVTNGLGWDLRAAMTFLAVAIFAHGAPSALNLAYSPFRHIGLETKKMSPLFPNLAAHQDLLVDQVRMNRLDGLFPLDGPGGGLEEWAKAAERKPPAELMGEKLADCEMMGGLTGWFVTVARDLEEAGFAGTRPYMADLFSALWLFGDFEPVRGAAPWYYGGLPGIGDATHLLVPLCPSTLSVRTGILKSVEEEGIGLREVRRTPLYILLEITRS